MNTRVWRIGVIALGFVAPLIAAPQAGNTDTPTTTVLKEEFRFGAAPPATPAPVSQFDTGQDVVKMERIVVRESKLLKQTFQMLDEKKAMEDAKAFTLEKGGRMWEGTFAGYPTEVGLWPWEDLLKEDARFQEASTLAKLDVVRIQW
ncbi:MAG TPA: hypothetical protein VGD81_15580 [Opitutaceae bacterium]